MAIPQPFSGALTGDINVKTADANYLANKDKTFINPWSSGVTQAPARPPVGATTPGGGGGSWGGTSVQTSKTADNAITQAKNFVDTKSNELATNQVNKAAQKAATPAVTGQSNQKFPIDGGTFVGTQAEYDQYLATHPQGKTSTTKTDTTTTDTGTGAPKQGADTGTTVMSDTAKAYADLDAQSQKLYDDFKASADALMNTTFTLTPEEQSQIDAVRAQFDDLKRQQQEFNKNYTGGSTNLEIATGRNRYAPSIAMGNIQKVVSDGVTKVAAIESKAASTIQSLKEEFENKFTTDQEGKWRRIGELYKSANDFLKEKKQTVKDINDTTKFELEVAKAKQDLAAGDFAAAGKLGDTVASSLVDTDESGKIIEPTNEEIMSYATKYDIAPEILAQSINERVDAVKKAGTANIESYDEKGAGNQTIRHYIDKTTGKELYKKSLGATYKIGGEAGGGTATDKRIQNYQKAVADTIKSLEDPDPKKRLSWPAAYDTLAIQYPEFVEFLNTDLGGGVPYDPTKEYGKQFDMTQAWGRANVPPATG